jgi:hypothetical protein
VKNSIRYFEPCVAFLFYRMPSGISLRVCLRADHSKPFIALAGETEPETPTNLVTLKSVWPALLLMNVNTVLPVVCWGHFEPEEGKFDFIDAHSEHSMLHVKLYRWQ